MDSSQVVYLHFLLHFEDQIVELVGTNDAMITGHRVVKASSFKIKVVSLGSTTLYVHLIRSKLMVQQLGHLLSLLVWIV